MWHSCAHDQDYHFSSMPRKNKVKIPRVVASTSCVLFLMIGSFIAGYQWHNKDFSYSPINEYTKEHEAQRSQIQFDKANTKAVIELRKPNKPITNDLKTNTPTPEQKPTDDKSQYLARVFTIHEPIRWEDIQSVAPHLSYGEQLDLETLASVDPVSARKRLLEQATMPHSGDLQKDAFYKTLTSINPEISNMAFVVDIAYQEKCGHSITANNTANLLSADNSIHRLYIKKDYLALKKSIYSLSSCQY